MSDPRDDRDDDEGVDPLDQPVAGGDDEGEPAQGEGTADSY